MTIENTSPEPQRLEDAEDVDLIVTAIEAAIAKAEIEIYQSKDASERDFKRVRNKALEIALVKFGFRSRLI